MRAPRALAALGAAFFTPAALATPGHFDVDFDVNPAPGAEGALRNKAYLPAQICGIIGAYIFCVLVVGVALLTYGRKMRRTVTERVDVVKANGATGFEMTPVSPSRGWRSPLSPSKLKHAFKRSQTSIAERQQQSVPTSPISPGCQSMSSFDQNFLKNQQEERQKEMERLYAAVMEHDEERQKKGARSSTEEIQEYPEEEDQYPVQQKGRPPMIDTAATLRVPSGQHPASPASPASPRSPIRAIYPPESPMAAARRHNYAGPPPTTQPSSPRGILSKKDRTASIGSTGSKSRRSIRNLRISGPIARYPGSSGGDDEEARTPLSPRFYNPGPPPSPPSATTAPTPTTPGTADSLGPFRYEDLEQPHPLPRPNPQRSASGSYHTPRPSNGSNTIDIAMRAGDAHHHHPSGPPPAIRTHDLPPPPRGPSAAKSAASSTSTLPLRSMVPESAQAPSTKTTVVEARNRTRDFMSPRTGNLRTPATGVPMTPYSPYMPYTPITPVTPHLVTRKERKQRQRDEKKMGLRSPLEEGDEVGDVDWGDAY